MLWMQSTGVQGFTTDAALLPVAVLRPPRCVSERQLNAGCCAQRGLRRARCRHRALIKGSRGDELQLLSH